MVVASNDKVTVTDLALAAYERALEPKRIALIPGGHFDPYLDEFRVAEAAATEWFRGHRQVNELGVGKRLKAGHADFP
jgi:fermentation-respiration switch protein FrsA (DUF1100 family)